MGLVSRIAVQVIAELTSAQDLLTATAPLSKKYTQDFASGVGANQADKMYSDQRTIAASGSETLDLAGGSLSDPLGVALTFAKIRSITVRASPNNANALVFGGDAAHVPVLSPVATGTISIRPGGILEITAPDAAGIAVTASTGDLLKFANGGAGSSVVYDITILGTSS